MDGEDVGDLKARQGDRDGRRNPQDAGVQKTVAQEGWSGGGVKVEEESLLEADAWSTRWVLGAYLGL